MTKALNAWIERRDIASATKLMAYVRRHPMVVCMLTEDEHGEWKAAEAFVCDHA